MTAPKASKGVGGRGRGRQDRERDRSTVGKTVNEVTGTVKQGRRRRDRRGRQGDRGPPVTGAVTARRARRRGGDGDGRRGGGVGERRGRCRDGRGQRRDRRRDGRVNGAVGTATGAVTNPAGTVSGAVERPRGTAAARSAASFRTVDGRRRRGRLPRGAHRLTLYSIGAHFTDRSPDLVEDVLAQSEEIEEVGLAAWAEREDVTLEVAFQTLMTGLAVRYFKAVAGAG